MSFATVKSLRKKVNVGAPAVFNVSGFLDPGETVVINNLQPPDTDAAHWKLSGGAWSPSCGNGNALVTLTNSTQERAAFCFEVCVHPRSGWTGVINNTTNVDSQMLVATAEVGVNVDKFCRDSCFTTRFDAHKFMSELLCVPSDCDEDALMDFINCGGNFADLIAAVQQTFKDYVERCAKP